MRYTTPIRATTLLAAGVLALSTTTERTLAQGCVAVRGGGMCPLAYNDNLTPDDANLQDGDWLASAAYRWLHSHRHFVGDHEQKDRQKIGNQVINQQHFFDVGLQYAITPRYSVGVVLPFGISDRSQTYTLGGVLNRYHTQSSGLGDARVTGYAWLWKPTRELKGNIQLGLGLKMPTGDDNVTDLFPSVSGGKVTWSERPVDQSIQPGDGGWGFTTEINAYRIILPRTTAYLQGFYLFNPEDTNDTLTFRGNPFESVTSIPDQYFGRVGLSYALVPKWGLSVSFGGRIEGVPVRDLLGDTSGFRRPGYAISLEPGIEVMKGRYSFGVSIPYAIFRNRQRSVADEAYTTLLGPGPNNYKHGDAAFADYVVTASFSVRF
ncbi:MAG TPA: hypothetical protein VMF06_03305 [Candidatus Limnocylindria bacterium]|jgi:hypothetical protein|nr:hypothetical protein [Candidatus Limnocylindria bacterium]